MKENCFKLWTLCALGTGQLRQMETLLDLERYECHVRDSLDEGKQFQTLDVVCVTYGTA